MRTHWTDTALQGGAITDSIIYCQYPGYSLKKQPKDGEKFASLASLVRHCPFLKMAAPQGDQARIAALLQRKLQVFVAEVLESVRRNGSDADALEWEISTMEALDTYHTPELCERRTVVRCGSRRECVFPELYTVGGRHLNALCEALAAPECRVVKRVCIRGYEGLARQTLTAALSDDGFVALCHALRTNRSVTELDVRVNGIGDAGATALAALLTCNETLRSVNLAQNFVTYAGALKIAAGLRYNHCMDDLTLLSQYECSPVDGSLVVSRDARLDTIGGALADALQRKRELFAPTDKGTYRVHGFMSDASAALLIRAVKPQLPGLYLLHRHAGHPDSLRLTYTTRELTVVHRTVQRVETGYTCNAALHGVPSLCRTAAWRLWAARSLDTAATAAAAPLPDDIALQLRQCSDMAALWRVQDVSAIDGDDAEPNADAGSAGGDAAWDAVYPTLFYLTCGLSRHLKVALNAKKKPD